MTRNPADTVFCSFVVSRDEADALADVTREHFDRLPGEPFTVDEFSASMLALIRFALAHMNDPKGGAPRFPPEPRAKATTALRTLADSKVRVLDRPGEESGPLLVWRDVRAYLELTDAASALATLIELPPHVPIPGQAGSPVRRGISLLDLERFGRDLDPVKQMRTIARLRALVEDVRRPPQEQKP